MATVVVSSHVLLHKQNKPCGYVPQGICKRMTKPCANKRYKKQEGWPLRSHPVCTGKQARVINVLSSSFSHPDCTVGSGITPDPALRRNFTLGRLAGLTCTKHDHRRSGISPCPEGMCSCIQHIILLFFDLTIEETAKATLLVYFSDEFSVK